MLARRGPRRQVFVCGVGGVLLGHAVQSTQAPDQVYAVDADHLVAGKDLGQRVQRHAVMGIVEGRNQDEPIRNIKVGITGRRRWPLKRTGLGNGNSTRSNCLPSAVRAPFNLSKFSASGS